MRTRGGWNQTSPAFNNNTAKIPTTPKTPIGVDSTTKETTKMVPPAPAPAPATTIHHTLSLPMALRAALGSICSPSRKDPRLPPSYLGRSSDCSTSGSSVACLARSWHYGETIKQSKEAGKTNSCSNYQSQKTGTPGPYVAKIGYPYIPKSQGVISLANAGHHPILQAFPRSTFPSFCPGGRAKPSSTRHDIQQSSYQSRPQDCLLVVKSLLRKHMQGQAD